MHDSEAKSCGMGASAFAFSVACPILTRRAGSTSFLHREHARRITLASTFARRRTTLHRRPRPRQAIHLSLDGDATSSSAPEDAAAESQPRGGGAGAQLTPFLRKALTAFSAVGVLETAYLTYTKLFSSPGAICATQGCLDVLAGPYSAFLGIPLSLFGMLFYGAFGALSAWPLLAQEEEYFVDVDEGTTALRSKEEVYEIRDASSRPLMLALASMLFVFSSYLMFLLVFVIKSMCPYCLFSHTLSFVLFILTAFVGRAVSDFKTAASIGGGGAVIAGLCAGASFFIATPNGLNAQIPTEPQTPPAITNRSTADTMRLAQKLEARDSKMYGAYWCTHCYDQKQKFGARAFKKIKYIECDQYGKDTKFKLCRDKRIPGYPTWEIGGKLYPGEIVLEDLEKLADEP